MGMIKSLLKLRYLFERRDVIKFAFLFVAITVMALFQVVSIASILPFMKLVASPEAIHENEWLQWVYQTGNFSSERTLLIAAGVAVLVLLAASNLFSAFTIWLSQKCAWLTAHRVAMRLVKTYTRLPYAFFLTRNSADLIKKVMAEVNNFVNGVMLAGGELVAHTLTSIVIFALLVAVEPVLTISAFAIFGGVYGLIYLTRRTYVEQLGRERLDLNYRQYKAAVEVLTGIKAIKTSGAHAYFAERFETVSNRYAVVHLRFQIFALIPHYIIEIFAFGGILATVLYLLTTGRDLLPALPTLSLFALAGYRLLPSLNKVFKAAAQMRHHFPVIDDLCDDIQHLDARPRRVDDDVPARVEFAESIELENVSYRYETAATEVLSEVNLAIPKYGRVAFVGSTGSGKTTLVDILVGLLPPEEGRLLIDGVPITRRDVQAWQRRIGYVPQEVFLYDDSIARNITFGLDGDKVEMDLMRSVCRLAEIDDFIMKELPDGYDTEIGERGVRLDGMGGEGGEREEGKA